MVGLEKGWGGLAEPRVRANTAPWTADEDSVLKDGIRAGLPQTGNLAATAAGLHRRLNRRPDGIMHRVNALRRLDPEFDRFIRQYVRRALDTPDDSVRSQADGHASAASVFASPGAAGSRRRPADGRGRGPGRPGRQNRPGNGVHRGASPRIEGPPARTPHPPALSLVEPGLSEAESARKAVDVLLPWLEARLGELPENARERLARLVYEEGATRVAVAAADAVLAATELLLNRAAATLRQWEAAEPRQVSGEGPLG